MNHVWKIGKFEQYDRFLKRREDKCLLCKCERTVFKENRKDGEAEVISYTRNQITFDRDPGCWGAKNPQ